jgi:hypothetical protein
MLPSPDKTSSPNQYFSTFLDKIQEREKQFKTGWWKTAESAVRMYDAESGEQNGSDNPYNILYSNTEVLLPSLYSNTPKPDVRARFSKENLKPIPEVIERYLTILSDPADPGVESLDQAMSENTLSSLTAGMGFIRLRYYSDRAVPLVFDAGHYKGIIWPKTRKWSKLPWIAFRHELTKEELFAQFKIKSEDEVNFSLSDEVEDEEDKTKPLGTVVYELWVKERKKVYYLCPDWQDILLSEEDDPLKLSGFFPTPGLMLMTAKPGKISPIPLYQYYRNQAEELNRVTVRLNKILSAIRVRGAYNSLLGEDLQKILSDNELENALVPASESGALLSQSGGFDRHIWMLPLDKLITVAVQLYQARQQIKQVIYELTGISDIIRGSSVASETATAQDLKNKWGTIRLRKMQTIVADYVRDLYRMAVDCSSKVLPPEKWKEMTQMDIPLAAEKQVAQQQLQFLAQQQMQAAQMAQMQGQPPSPPKPPDPQLIKTLQSPTMEEVLEKISSDANRTYTINVQTSSTVDMDTGTDKQEVQEFMNAMGQLMSGLAPLTQLGPTGLEASKAILIAVCQRFKFGLQIVDSIEAIQAPPPQDESASEKAKSDAELQIIQAETQAKLSEIEANKSLLAAKIQFEQQKLQIEHEKLQIEKEKMQIELTKARLGMQQTALKMQQQSQPKPQERSGNAPVSS